MPEVSSMVLDLDSSGYFKYTYYLELLDKFFGSMIARV